MFEICLEIQTAKITDMLQVGNGNVKNILQLFSYAKKLDHELGLFAEMSIDSERLFCIDMGHLKIVLYRLIVRQVEARYSN